MIIPVLASAAARPLAHRLEPRQATWLLCAAAVVISGGLLDRLEPRRRAVLDPARDLHALVELAQAGR